MSSDPRDETIKRLGGEPGEWVAFDRLCGLLAIAPSVLSQWMMAGVVEERIRLTDHVTEVRIPNVPSIELWTIAQAHKMYSQSIARQRLIDDLNAAAETVQRLRDPEIPIDRLTGAALDRVADTFGLERLAASPLTGGATPETDRELRVRIYALIAVS